MSGEALEPPTLDVAARMDAVHDAVSRYVGWAPDGRIRVIDQPPLPFGDDGGVRCVP